MLTVVPDATVLVSAAISRVGNPDRILKAWQASELSLVVCPQLLQEVRSVLLQPRLRRYLSEEEANEFVDLLETAADLRADPDVVERVVPADPKDDYLFALAREAGVDVVLSGDKHVTGLESPRPRVVTPAQLVAELERWQRGRPV
ncbi:MAG: putative toxin-antitoxin system toxin component, PIN family [Chloroflexota bacterium]